MVSEEVLLRLRLARPVSPSTIALVRRHMARLPHAALMLFTVPLAFVIPEEGRCLFPQELAHCSSLPLQQAEMPDGPGERATRHTHKQTDTQTNRLTHRQSVYTCSVSMFCV